MYREIIDAALETERQRRHHGMLLQYVETIDAGLQNNWHGLLQQMSARVPSTLQIRVRPQTLSIELEDLLAEWRELWNSDWFVPARDRRVTSEWTLQDVIAHVASWSMEMRIQAEMVAKGLEVPYRILFEKSGGPRSWNAEQVELRRGQALKTLTSEVEGETARLQNLLFEVERPILFVERPIGIAFAAAAGEPWIKSIAGIVEMRCFHDRWHTHRIREWKRENLAGES